MGRDRVLREFGSLIKLARLEASLSRARAAAKLKISPKTVQSWEEGRTFISDLSLIPKVSDLYGVDILALLKKAF